MMLSKLSWGAWRAGQSVRPSGSKAADNLLRIAGILAVVEESGVVEVDYIQRASALVGYYLTRDPAPDRA